MNIYDYGYSSDLPSQQDDLFVARITGVHRDRFDTVCNAGESSARLKAGVYYGGSEPFPTAGDFVLLDWNESGDSRIVRTLPRSTWFSRRDPDPGRGEQAVAANFGIVFLLQSLNHDFNLKRLERYLTLTWQSGASPVVVLTKADLASGTEMISAAERLASGAPVHAVSAFTGSGLGELHQYLPKGQTAVFLGSSGVGKSSLLNALAGSQLMPVGEIREQDGRGRHTTTHRQLFCLAGGAMIIDTPGMRELGMWDVTEGLAEAFEDVECYLGKCRFSNCSHTCEPGCAVLAAIKTGALSQDRWDSYIRLQAEAEYADNRGAYLKKKQQWHKQISIKNKNAK